MPQDTLTMILAGGKGTRLEPLTRERAKPAVPFAGSYRIIDFTLSNCVNSGIRKMMLLTQYKSRSLDRHIRDAWGFLSNGLGDGIEVLPPQQRLAEQWYQGTADAIYQNIYSIEQETCQTILILSGDHIYKMNYQDMLTTHLERYAELTIGAIPVPLHETDQFGILNTDEQDQVTAFIEKPKSTVGLNNLPGYALGSMGIYIFNRRILLEYLCDDATQRHSSHDFGKNIIPQMIAAGERVVVHRFINPCTGQPSYWRDVGTIDAYYEANLELLNHPAEFDLDDQTWPFRSYRPQLAPARIMNYEAMAEGSSSRGRAEDCLLSPGCRVHGGFVYHSVLSPKVQIHQHAVVEDSILLDGVVVGHHARIRRAIIDKQVCLPPFTELGYDLEFDRARGFTVSERGVVVVGKNELPEAFRVPNRLTTRESFPQ